MSRKWLLSLILIVPTCSALAESSNQGWNLSNAVGNTLNDAISSAGSGSTGGFLGPDGGVAGGIDPLKDPELATTARELAENDGVLSSRVRESIKEIHNEANKSNADEAARLMQEGEVSKYKGGNPNPGEAEMYRVKDMMELMKDKGIRDHCVNPHVIDVYASGSFEPTCCVREGEEFMSRTMIEFLHPDRPFEYLVEAWLPASVAEIAQPMESQRISAMEVKPQEMKVMMLKKTQGGKRIQSAIQNLQGKDGASLGGLASGANVQQDANEFMQKVQQINEKAPFTAPLEDGYFYRAGHAMTATAFTDEMKEALARSYAFHKDQFKKFEVQKADPWGTDFANGAKYIYQPEKNYELKNYMTDEPSNPRKGMQAYSQDKLYCQKMNTKKRTPLWLAETFKGKPENGDGSQYGYMCAKYNNGAMVPLTDYHQAADQRTTGSWVTAWRTLNLASYDPEMKQKYIPYEKEPYQTVLGVPWPLSFGEGKTFDKVPDKIFPAAHDKYKKECLTQPVQDIGDYEKNAKYLDKSEKNFESWINMRFVRTCPKNYKVWKNFSDPRAVMCNLAPEKLK